MTFLVKALNEVSTHRFFVDCGRATVDKKKDEYMEDLKPESCADRPDSTFYLISAQNTNPNLEKLRGSRRLRTLSSFCDHFQLT